MVIHMSINTFRPSRTAGYKSVNIIKIHTIRKKYCEHIQFSMDIYFIALARVRCSTLDHEAQLLSQGWSEPSSLTSGSLIWVPEQQGCNWGMQIIDGCSLKLCVGSVATLSVVSFFYFLFFFNTIFVSSHMYPENPEGTQVIVGSMNMGYISDTARNRTHNLFRPKREPIPLGHNDGHLALSHINKLNSIAWLFRDDSIRICLHYITLHYMVRIDLNIVLFPIYILSLYILLDQYYLAVMVQ